MIYIYIYHLSMIASDFVDIYTLNPWACGPHALGAYISKISCSCDITITYIFTCGLRDVTLICSGRYRGVAMVSAETPSENSACPKFIDDLSCG